MTDPSVEADAAPVVAGVLLAAGESSRFGEANKLLASLDGRPVVAHAVAPLVAARVDPVVVVVGFEADRVRAALAEYPVEFVDNPAYADGQSTSVQAGIAALDERVDAAVVALGDMPYVTPESVRALLDTFEAGAGDVLAAADNGIRGNPVLFGRDWFDALADVSGDIGGRDLVREHGVLVETGDPGVRRDVDVPGDLTDPSDGNPG